jgi:hypothetical protein
MFNKVFKRRPLHYKCILYGGGGVNSRIVLGAQQPLLNTSIVGSYYHTFLLSSCPPPPCRLHGVEGGWARESVLLGCYTSGLATAGVFILPFYFPISHFLSPFFLFLSPFFIFFPLSCFSFYIFPIFLIVFSYFFSQMTSADIHFRGEVFSYKKTPAILFLIKGED